VQCPHCRQPCRDGVLFCGTCGEPLTPASDQGGTVALGPGQQIPSAQLALVDRAPGMPEQVALLTGSPVRIGGAEDCDLRLTDPAFAHHAVEVAEHKGDYVARDIHGGHGLIAEGVKVNQAVLSTRDPVYIPSARGRAASLLLRPLAHGAVDGLSGTHTPSVGFRPGTDTLTIGRDPTNDLVVDYPLVSLDAEAFAAVGVSEADGEKSVGEAMLKLGFRNYATKLQMGAGEVKGGWAATMWPPADSPEIAMRRGSTLYSRACAFSQRTAVTRSSTAAGYRWAGAMR